MRNTPTLKSINLRRMSHRVCSGILVGLHLTLSGCGGPDTATRRSSEFEPIKDAIKHQLRDPDSAQFRNERIRVLWSTGGKRITVYCADINSNNGFGGKTGFQSSIYYISTGGLGSLAQFYKPGAFWIYTEFNANYYLECVRPDTQRRNEDMGKAIPMPTEFAPEEIDRENPIISMATAPEQ